MEKSQINVLFIDDEIFDNENERESYKIAELEKDGDIKVDPVVNAMEALQYLKKETPNIIVLDIMMTSGDDTGDEIDANEAKDGLETGFVLLKKIVEDMGLQIPIIVLTNYPKDPKEKYKSVVEYLAKPVKMSRLAELVRNYTIEHK